MEQKVMKNASLPLGTVGSEIWVRDMELDFPDWPEAEYNPPTAAILSWIRWK